MEKTKYDIEQELLIRRIEAIRDLLDGVIKLKAPNYEPTEKYPLIINQKVILKIARDAVNLAACMCDC